MFNIQSSIAKFTSRWGWERLPCFYTTITKYQNLVRNSQTKKPKFWEIQSPSDTQPSRYNILCRAASFFMFILSRMLRYYHDHYSYWFFLLYCSVNSRSFLNFSTLSSFIFPALRAFLLALSQFRWSCSSILCLDGFRLFVSINVTTSLYFAIHFSFCVIFTIIKFCQITLCYTFIKRSHFKTITFCFIEKFIFQP